jgi:integrase
VPKRLRHAVGKFELIASTGTSEIAIARIVGGELLAQWRRRLFELDRGHKRLMDVLQVAAGSPTLKLEGWSPVSEAAALSGLDSTELLRHAAAGRLSLRYLPVVRGYVIGSDDIERSMGELIFPTARQMSDTAIERYQTDLVSVREPQAVAASLLTGVPWEAVAFDIPGSPDSHFVPEKPLCIMAERLHVSRAEVETLRASVAATITKSQLELAAARLRVAQPSSETGRRGTKLLSEAIDAYMKDNETGWAPDHGRRVRSACELLVEMLGDGPIHSFDRDRLRSFRDEVLPTIPEHENKIRLKHGTRSVTESIAAVAGTGWPVISESERTKRMKWISTLFGWLVTERWITDDPALGLGNRRRRHLDRKTPTQKKRDVFIDGEFAMIFGSTWFKTGSGELTRAGTYRRYSPHYYWLPLLGLYTGARINELCQLALSDIRCSPSGTWFLDINDEEARKKLKTTSAVRSVPVHPHLIELGLIQWGDRLRTDGYKRLFPELKHDAVKGYSKAAVKWFSTYLQRFGIERDNTKVFHSFRHGLTTVYEHDFRLPLSTVRQLAGWSRGSSVAESTYRHDESVDKTAAVVRQVKFNLPAIAKFNHDAGVKAVSDALARKNGGRGARED